MKEKEKILDKNNTTLGLEKMTKNSIVKNQISKKKILKEKGITLIALVVTIIILLILAGVTLNIALSDGGLFSKTQEASDKYKQAQEDEELEIEKIEYAVEGKDITKVQTISDEEGFKNFRDKVNEGEETFENTLIKLSSDLDLSGEVWTPIGTTSHPFNGVFNGNGYEINNLLFEENVDKDYLGLFGYNKGIIKNIGINSSELQSNGTTTAVGAITGCNEGIVEGCYNTANISSDKINYLGGIVGENKTGGKIRKCYNTGEITGLTVDMYKMIGGICGNGVAGESIISCYNAGKIDIETNFNNAQVGGICGDSFGTVDSCYNKGDIQLSDISGKNLDYQAVGGILGQSRAGYVIRCFNIGNITLNGSDNLARNASIIGGIWSPGNVEIKDCYMNDNINVTYRCPGEPDDIASKDFGKATVITDGIKDSLYKKLGENFKEDKSKINDGYPILEWQ